MVMSKACFLNHLRFRLMNLPHQTRHLRLQQRLSKLLQNLHPLMLSMKKPN
jgi:hypothetical protein